MLTIIFLILTLFLSSPLLPSSSLKINFPTWASTAESGSSNKYMSASEYVALAKLTLCFWPPLRFRPYDSICHILLSIINIKHHLYRHLNVSWARYTFTLRPPLVAVSGAHQFQVSRVCLPMPAWSRSSLTLWSFPTCRQLQLPTSSFIVIIIVNDSTNTIHYSPRPCLSSGWKPSLEQSAARRHISSDSRCFPESTPNLPVLSFVCTLTDTYTLFSGLAVFI